MLSLLRVASLVKLVVAEFIAMVCLSAAFGWALSSHGVLGCPPSGAGLTGTFFGAVLIGLGLTAWVVWRAAWPDEIRETWRPVTKVGPVVMQNPAIADVEYSFATTHPTYAILDFLQLGPALILFMLGRHPPEVAGCSTLFNFLMGRAALVVALFFPLCRLVSWYVLEKHTSEAAQRGAWKPVALLCAALIPATFIVPLLVFLPRLNLPVVNATTWTGGLGAHPEFSGKIVRLHGLTKSQKAARCVCSDKDPNACRVAALLVDLGAGGEVIVHGSSDYASDLVKEGRRGAGQAIEVIGRLGPLPVIATKNDDARDCGQDEFGPASPAGRAFLHIEYP